MFERYDEPARRVLLLGLIREMNSLAGPVLGALPRLDTRKELEEQAAITLALILEDLSGLKATLEGMP